MMTTIFKWDKSMSVYITEIDDQHKKLFEMIEVFQDDLKNDYDRKPIINLVDKLKEYAGYHFKTEETWMKRYNYPQTAIHQHSHKEFIQTVNIFEDQLKEGKAIQPSEISNFLKDWIMKHLALEDKLFGNYLKENRFLDWL